LENLFRWFFGRIKAKKNFFLKFFDLYLSRPRAVVVCSSMIFLRPRIFPGQIQLQKKKKLRIELALEETQGQNLFSKQFHVNYLGKLPPLNIRLSIESLFAKK
jgi:hypothetical protein